MSVKSKPKRMSLEALGQAAECLRTLAHPHRLRMIQMLLEGRYAVGELAEACEIPSHMASEHLRLLQRSGFLKPEKDGRFVSGEIVSTIQLRPAGPTIDPARGALEMIRTLTHTAFPDGTLVIGEDGRLAPR